LPLRVDFLGVRGFRKAPNAPQGCRSWGRGPLILLTFGRVRRGNIQCKQGAKRMDP
jgi:hypothetical protein